MAYRSQWTFLHSTLEGQSPVRAGSDAIQRGANASWFEWLEGSAPLFQNWGDQYQQLIRDSQPHFMTGPFPLFLKPQKKHKDHAKHFLQPQKKHKDPAKHELMRTRWYRFGNAGTFCQAQS